MPRRAVLAAVIALVTAAGCIRLGVWQLQRLAERRARNAEVVRAMRGEAVELATLPADTSALRYRRVRVRGTFDFDHEFVLAYRSRDGAPGVYVITPLRAEGGGRVVLVNRGWVYSADARTVDLARWREPAEAEVTGYVDLFPPARGEARVAGGTHAWRRLDSALLAPELPYPVAPLVLVALEDSAAAAARAREPVPVTTPVRLPLPALDEGSHQSYALQWFAFATIALVGGGLIVRREIGGPSSRASFVVPPAPPL